jgi:hypothetical protein
MRHSLMSDKLTHLMGVMLDSHGDPSNELGWMSNEARE